MDEKEEDEKEEEVVIYMYTRFVIHSPPLLHPCMPSSLSLPLPTDCSREVT